MKANQILREWGDFFEERNKDYGDAYLRFGEVANLLFPNGLQLECADDFYSFHIIVLALVKFIRITNAFQKGEEHEDSWKDLAVYAAMYMEKLEEKK